MQPAGLPRQREPQPAAALVPGTITAHEAVEDHLPQVARDARSRILHLDPCPGILRGDRHDHRLRTVL